MALTARAFLGHSRSVRLTVVLVVILGVILSVGRLGIGQAAADTPPASGQFVPLSTSRVINTTSGSFTDSADGVIHSGKLLSNQTVNYVLPGHGGIPSTHVLAAVLHVTTFNGSAAGVGDGYIWVYPATSGTAVPTQSNDPHPLAGLLQNDGGGDKSDNTVIVPVGDNGQVSIYDGASASDVDMYVDVTGYITDGTGAAGADYAPLNPYRALSNHAVTSSAAYPLNLLGVDGLPNSASSIAAVALNLSASGSTTDCSVAATSATASDPSVAQKDFTYAGGTASQLVLLAPSTTGNVYLSTDCASVNASVDIEGYYIASSTGQTANIYVPINPVRVADTRPDSNMGIAPGKIPANTTIGGDSSIVVTGLVDGDDDDDGTEVVPDYPDVSAVAVSIDTFGANAGSGSVELWPDGTTRPANITTVGVDSDTNESNLAFIQPGTLGGIDLYNGPDATNVTIEVDGYFQQQPPSQAGCTELSDDEMASFTQGLDDSGATDAQAEQDFSDHCMDLLGVDAETTTIDDPDDIQPANDVKVNTYLSKDINYRSPTDGTYQANMDWKWTDDKYVDEMSEHGGENDVENEGGVDGWVLALSHSVYLKSDKLWTCGRQVPPGQTALDPPSGEDGSTDLHFGCTKWTNPSYLPPAANGVGFVEQDKTDIAPTYIPGNVEPGDVVDYSAYRGSIQMNFLSNNNHCHKTQAFSSMVHTWSSTGVTGFNIGISVDGEGNAIPSIIVSVSSQSHKWQLADNGPKRMKICPDVRH